MKRRLIIIDSQQDHRAWLYSLVFKSKTSVLVVVVLFVSFLTQPIQQAFADTTDTPEDATAQSDESVTPENEPDQSEVVDAGDNVETIRVPVIETKNTNEPEAVTSEETDAEEVEKPTTASTSDSKADTAETETTTEDAESGETSSVSDADTVTNASSSDQALAISTSTNQTATATTTTNTVESAEVTATSTGSIDQEQASSTKNEDSNPTGDGNQSETESTNESTNNQSTDNETTDSENTTNTETNPAKATSSEEIQASPSLEPQTIEAVSMVGEDNFYQFSRQSCVAVGDGTYHCTSTETEEYDNRSVVFADVGPNGNLEIFLETAQGDVRQITDNDVDDSSPYYDPATLQIVWQRLIDGRHQVILYDIVADEESQLTFSRTNNMEPKVSSDGVVWQAWDNNDWEIMFFDGTFTDQITDNNVQDVAPTIQDRYILWTVIGRGDQEGKVYSLDSEELLTISGYDGGVIENPRFVLVYDTKFDNGDIITQGFDPSTGVSQPISAQPAPDPIDIPMPDPIGEIRAMIQQKSTIEDDLEHELVHDETNSSSTATTTTDTLDLNVHEEGDETMDLATTTPDNEFELTEFDLVLSDVSLDFDELSEIDEIIAEETASSTQ